ncbi:LamG-like jellyroll fold domain-containing protein [Catenovulum agarivorans]|uniref:LamG-like jellyroll fold domain-containing protein n=1 Tax=Catenovulum agarivorans TaxID=1172192 RepID=UPI00030D18D4|nr:LamG-like jellyroll fold domain-containing protein [Catenovulum agarivorans]
MNRSDQFEQIRLIADDVCNNNANQQQLAKLQQLLKGDLQAQEFYFDYLNLHVNLIDSFDQETEFVYRRMTMAEEFVMRPKGGNDPVAIDSPDKTLESKPGPSQQQNQATSSKFNIKSLVIFILLLLCLLWLFFGRHNSDIVAELVQGKVNVLGEQGDIDGGTLTAGIYEAKQAATIELASGDTCHLEANTVIKLYNKEELRLRTGIITLESLPEQNTIIHNPGFLIETHGSTVTIDLTSDAPKIISGKASVFTSSTWRPVHFWNFNEQNDRFIDTAGIAHGVAAVGLTRVKGVVGQAVNFGNHEDEVISVGSGGGTVPGTGSFAVDNGLTIETLIKLDFTNELDKKYTIFHQQQRDDDVRISLNISSATSQQNALASINFGLSILGQGYHELNFALDGQDGRPTLAQLIAKKFNHLAATYNAHSGIQAIYLNGEKLASYKHPKGSKVFSGGAVSTTIGNTPNSSQKRSQVFSGVIDEVAFYSLALPEYTIKQHVENISQGKSYFGFAASAKPLPEDIKFDLPAYSVIELDTDSKLPSKLLKRK